MYRILRASALVICCVALAFGADASGGNFKVVKRIPLEGGGRWDYVTADSDSHRVYIARATHVSVLDSETGAVVGDIPDTPGVHGVAIAEGLGIGFISEGQANKVAVFDLKTLKVISQTPRYRVSR